MIQPWLDPVIASKINFTSNNTDMQRYISPDQLQKSYGGQDDWEYSYIDPKASENEHPPDKRPEIEAERESLLKKFEELTAEWAAMGPESADARQKMDERTETAKLIGDNFWKFDPYVRARTYYHRVGVVGPAGEVDYKAAK
jgi:CRAL/TRIO-like protein